MYIFFSCFFSIFWGISSVLEYHFGILYIVIPFKMYNFTNLATWVHLGYLCGTPGWLHDKCHFGSYHSETLHKYCCPLMFFTEIVLIILSECLFCLVHFKDDDTTIKINNVFFIVLSKPDLLCYILLHSIHIYTNFRVFSFKWYQEYAYPWFCAWATGC